MQKIKFESTPCTVSQKTKSKLIVDINVEYKTVKQNIYPQGYRKHTNLVTKTKINKRTD